MKIKDLYKKKKYVPLPIHKFPLIKPTELNPLDVCLNLDTNPFTAYGEHRVRGYKYKEVPTHAYMHIRHQIMLNVGLWGVHTEELSYYMKKSQIILVIHFTRIDWGIEDRLIDVALREFKKTKKLRPYDFKGFLSFIPYAGKIIKPSEKDDFCSDNCVDVGQAVMYAFFVGIDSEKFTPADFLLRGFWFPGVEIRLLEKICD